MVTRNQKKIVKKITRQKHIWNCDQVKFWDNFN
jgi:hypothetical protein